MKWFEKIKKIAELKRKLCKHEITYEEYWQELQKVMNE